MWKSFGQNFNRNFNRPNSNVSGLLWKLLQLFVHNLNYFAVIPKYFVQIEQILCTLKPSIRKLSKVARNF